MHLKARITRAITSRRFLKRVNDPQFDEYKTVKNGKIFTLKQEIKQVTEKKLM
jgi:hypothetical protein